MSCSIRRVTFLTARDAQAAAPTSLHRILTQAAQNIGWQAACSPIDSLRLDQNRLSWQVGDGWRSQRPGDLLWITSLGARASFLDKMQLLQTAGLRMPIVNNPRAIFLWHSKYPLVHLQSTDLKIPITYAGSDPDWLYEQITHLGGHWVLKPPAGSRGEGIQILSCGDSDARARLDAGAGAGAGYQILQQWIPEVSGGEKRILLAGGKVVGQYLRTARASALTNLAQGGVASACDLNQAERLAMKHLARRLLDQGIFFAGVDLCWPWLIEVNVLSPGGLATILDLTGEDLSQSVFTAVTEAISHPNGSA